MTLIFSVARGFHTSAFDARSLHCGSNQHASDLRDFMVQTRDIHEANSSLEILDIYKNQISDEGATALAQALKARFVVCSLMFLWPFCRHSRQSSHTASLAQSLLCHVREINVYSCQPGEVLCLSANIGGWCAPGDVAT